MAADCFAAFSRTLAASGGFPLRQLVQIELAACQRDLINAKGKAAKRAAKARAKELRVMLSYLPEA